MLESLLISLEKHYAVVMKNKSGVGQGSYETRLRADARTHAALSELAAIFSVVERQVFTQVLRGGLTPSFKKEFLRSHGIPGRLFNSVRASVYGRIEGPEGVSGSSESHFGGVDSEGGRG